MDLPNNRFFGDGIATHVEAIRRMATNGKIML